MDSNTKEYFNKLQQHIHQYQSTLQKSLDNNETEQQNIQKEIETTKNLMKQLELLSERPEWPDSFIPINSIAYIPATICHTSEYYVKLGSECYAFMSLTEILKYFERKVNNHEEVLDGYKEECKQLEERFKTVLENTVEVIADTKDMPVEIASEMGSAYKTASGFYEIVEPYDEDKEKEFYKKRKQNKSTKTGNEHIDSYLNKLENLEKEELLSEDFKLQRRVKAVLESSNLYQELLNDDLISDYCNTLEVEPQQTETLLNELIIQALVIEPKVYKSEG